MALMERREPRLCHEIFTASKVHLFASDHRVEEREKVALHVMGRLEDRWRFRVNLSRQTVETRETFQSKPCFH